MTSSIRKMAAKVSELLFPWPSREQRQRDITRARAEAALSRRRAAQGRKVQAELEGIREDRVAGAIVYGLLRGV